MYKRQTLLDDLLQVANQESVTLLVLLDLSAASDTIDRGILLEWLSELEIGVLVYQ